MGSSSSYRDARGQLSDALRATGRLRDARPRSVYGRRALIRNPKAILALLTTLNLLNYLDRYVLSAVLKPLQDDLQLSKGTAGSLATVFLLGFFATSPLFGHLADRAGPAGRRALIVVGVVVWSLATFSSGLAHGAGSLVVSRAFVGIGEASYVTIAPTLIDEIAPAERKGRWLAIFYTAIPVGSALGYLTGGAIEHATHSWRQAFFVAGLPGLVLAVLCLLIRETPAVPTPAADSPAVRASSRPSVAGPGPLLHTVRRLLNIPLYRSIVLGQCAYTFAIGGFAHWAPTYIAERYGMESGRASFVFGLVTVAGGAIGTLVGGRLGDHAARGSTTDGGIARGNLGVCALATGVGAPLAAVAIAAGTGNAFFAIMLPCEIALFIPGGPFNVAILRSVPPELRASAMAFSIFASHLLGDLWSPWLIGVVWDVAPMAWALVACPVAYALAAFVWWRGSASVRLT
jgi:MFS transporter, Spinster family, sphingosine-1-phosphate transporter